MAEVEPTQSNAQDGRTDASRRGDEANNGHRLLLEISNAMVRVYKDQFGRGPTKVRTDYAGPATVVCLLEHSFTPAERNLQAMGEHQRLRDIRMLFQYAEASRFTEPVERLLGRRVRGFISGIDTNADIACEMFVLEPEGSSAGDTPMWQYA